MQSSREGGGGDDLPGIFQPEFARPSDTRRRRRRRGGGINARGPLCHPAEFEFLASGSMEPPLCSIPARLPPSPSPYACRLRRVFRLIFFFALDLMT